MSKKNI